MKYLYFIISLFLALPAYGAELEVDYPGGELNKLADEGQLGPLQWAETIYNFAFAIVGIVAFISLVIAGIKWMTSRQEEGVKDAKDRIQGVVYGILLLGASYLLLNLINPDLTKLREPFVDVPKSTLSEPTVEKPPEGVPGTPASKLVGTVEMGWSTGTNPSAGENASLAVRADVTSGGTYRFVIDWGDGTNGSTQSAQATPGSTAGNYIVTSRNSHTYARAGTYTVKVVILDPRGGTEEKTLSVVVAGNQEP